MKISGPLLTNAVHWEHAAIHAIRPPWIPQDQLAQLTKAYLQLSERHIHHADIPTGQVHSHPTADYEFLVRLLIFARRTFLVATRLRHLLPLDKLPLVEHGAGFAPALLALHNHQPTTAVELTTEYASLRDRLFAFAGHLGPIALTHYRPQPHKPAVHIYSYSLYEYAHGDPQAAANLLTTHGLKSWYLIIEPGDQRHSHFIQRVRDLCVANNSAFSILAPCPAAATSCPMHTSKDWCHFRVHHQSGPLEERILSRAGRTTSWISYSYLLLGPSQMPALTPKARVLSLHPEGKAKLRLQLCNGNTIDHAEVLKRDRLTYDMVSMLEPNALVQLHPEVKKTPSQRAIRLRSPRDLSVIDTNEVR